MQEKARQQEQCSAGTGTAAAACNMAAFYALTAYYPHGLTDHAFPLN